MATTLIDVPIRLKEHMDEMMPAGTSTKVLRAPPDPDTEHRWRRFLASAQWPSHHLAPEYFLEPKVRGKHPFAVLAERGTEIVGCLTGWHDGPVVVSGKQTHPQLLLGDVPARDEVEAALAHALLVEAAQSSCVVVHSWDESDRFREAGFQIRPCDSTYMLDLALDEETLFRQLDGKRRHGIRYALRHGIDAHEAGPDDLPRFYEVLQATHRRLELDAPLPIHDLLVPDTNRKLFVAYDRGSCIGGTILRLQAGGLAEYSENASLPEFWPSHPNDLLLWQAIVWARRAGCAAFNLAGHNLFKKEFGGTLRPVFRFRLDKSFLRLRDRREWLETSARRFYRAVKEGVFE
jgi:hypothetical protein